jgi:hypothetical protein
MSREKFVRIEWVDSSSSSRIWNSRESLMAHDNERCVSIGYLVHEDKDCVVVAGHKGTHDFAGDMRIPKRAIVKRKNLKEPT